MNHQELENKIRSTKSHIKRLERRKDDYEWDMSQLKEHLNLTKYDLKNQINDLRFFEEKLKELK
jgi:hypothetical protein